MKSGRLARIAARVLLVIASLCIAEWVRSHWWMDTAEYRFGALVAPGAPDGEPGMWTFRARRVFAWSFSGGIGVGLSEYRSLGPTREDMDRWSSYGGWGAARISRRSVRPDAHPLNYFESRVEFSLLGFGTRSEMRGGEETRTITIPYWLIAGVLMVTAAALWLPSHRRARRTHRGLCIHCGYDLASAPPPCPECGQGSPAKSHISTSVA